MSQVLPQVRPIEITPEQLEKEGTFNSLVISTVKVFDPETGKENTLQFRISNVYGKIYWRVEDIGADRIDGKRVVLRKQ